MALFLSIAPVRAAPNGDGVWRLTAVYARLSGKIRQLFQVADDGLGFVQPSVLAVGVGDAQTGDFDLAALLF